MRLLGVLMSLLLVCTSAYAEVLKETTVNARRITIVLADGAGVPNAINGRIVFTELGRNNIKSLRKIDILLDRNGQPSGVRLLYEDSIAGLQSMYIGGVKAILIEQGKGAFMGRGVLLRTVTTEELAAPW